MKKVKFENLGKECAKAYLKWNEKPVFLSSDTEDWKEELFNGNFEFCEELSKEGLTVDKKYISKLNLTIYIFTYCDSDDNIIDTEYYLS